MVTVTINVARAQATAVRAALLTVYQLEVESLRRACEALLRGRGSSATVQACRDAVMAVDELMSQAGWDVDSECEAELSLTGPSELLGDVLYGALLEELERLERSMTGAWRDRAARDDARKAALGVVAVLELLDEVAGARGA